MIIVKFIFIFDVQAHLINTLVCMCVCTYVRMCVCHVFAKLLQSKKNKKRGGADLVHL